MMLRFLPYVREGFRPSADGSATVSWRALARVNTRVASTGKPVHDAATRFDLLGPGDIVATDTAQVLRVLPARTSSRAEPEFFPCVDLDAPDLPWAYSRSVPGSNRPMPWICLIVVEEQSGVSLRPGDRGQSPWILSLDAALAAHELPDLTEAWSLAIFLAGCIPAIELGWGFRLTAVGGMLALHRRMVDAVRLDLEQYFAITSTSMQFGAAAHAVVGCSWGKVTADLSFDVLLMTESTLHFEADLAARVSVNVFGADLLTAGFEGSLEGPGPSALAGKVTWKVWCFHVHKHFRHEWGEPSSIPVATVSAGQILAAEIASAANWTSYRTRTLSVKLRSGVAGPLAPCDELEVRQTRLPFATGVEVLAGNGLSDAGVWTLSGNPANGVSKLADVREVFPERRFLEQPSMERPFRDGLSCGARFGRSDWDTSTVAIASDSSATDDDVVDTPTVVAGEVAAITIAADVVLAASLPTMARARISTREPTREAVR